MKNYIVPLLDGIGGVFTAAWFPNVAAVVGIGFAAVAAYLSLQAINANRELAYQNSMFQLRQSALQEYTRAQGAFSSVLQQVGIKLPYRIKPVTVLQSLTIDEIKEIAETASEAQTAYRDYTTNVNAARGVWPEEVESAIVSAGAAANEASACYRVTGMYPARTNDQFWLDKRAEMCRICQNVDVQMLEFENESAKVVKLMLKHMESAWTAEAPKKF